MGKRHEFKPTLKCFALMFPRMPKKKRRQLYVYLERNMLIFRSNLFNLKILQPTLFYGSYNCTFDMQRQVNVIVCLTKFALVRLVG